MALKINFVLPPSPRISGGPLAILEYASRFQKRGHEVSITTYPDEFWEGRHPFPWFDFEGRILYKTTRTQGQSDRPSVSADFVKLLGHTDYSALADAVVRSFGLQGLKEVVLRSSSGTPEPAVDFLQHQLILWSHLIDSMPECDLNIATLWSTAFPVYLSGKGKPVYFMQHYEEVFYPLQSSTSIMSRLLARMSYALPIYKVANSSWLQKVIRDRVGQKVPFSNNGMDLSDFAPRQKRSARDGIIRVFTYSRPDEWKGFGDAVAGMSRIRKQYGRRVEWHVFGYRHETLAEDNPYASYKYHPGLSFAELAELYATSDIALCPSWFESFPLPPLEAMASGTSVITTDYGTEDYAFHDRNSLVVRSRDVNGMVDALGKLIEDEALRERLVAQGLNTARSFSWDNAVERRERILWDIHLGSTDYDVSSGLELGLKDSHGVPFEAAPADVPQPTGMYWHEGMLYLLYRGVKHHITSPNLIPVLATHGIGYADIDALSFIRTPTGSPIATQSQLPDGLITASATRVAHTQSKKPTDDVPANVSGVVSTNGHVFIIQAGVRRHVCTMETVQLLHHRKVPVIDPNTVSLTDMPLGPPVVDVESLSMNS
jgi:glycosyltransferase involved in cell wall biosynthesis